MKGGEGIPDGTLEMAKRRKHKPGRAIPSGCRRDKEAERERDDAAGRSRGYRGRAESDRALARAGGGGCGRGGEEEEECDEGFTGAVMFAGSRNFGVSEPVGEWGWGMEPYLNEPG